MDSVHDLLEYTSVENPDIYEIGKFLTIYDRPTGDSAIFEIMNNQAVIESVGPSFTPFRKELLVLVQSLGTVTKTSGSVETSGRKDHTLQMGVTLTSTKSGRVVYVTKKAARIVMELLYCQLDLLEEHELIGEYDLIYDHATTRFTLHYNTYDGSSKEDIFNNINDMGDDPVIIMDNKERYITLHLL